MIISLKLVPNIIHTLQEISQIQFGQQMQQLQTVMILLSVTKTCHLITTSISKIMTNSLGLLVQKKPLLYGMVLQIPQQVRLRLHCRIQRLLAILQLLREQIVIIHIPIQCLIIIQKQLQETPQAQLTSQINYFLDLAPLPGEVRCM